MIKNQSLSEFITARWNALAEEETRIKENAATQLRQIEEERLQLTNAASAAGLSLTSEAQEKEPVAAEVVTADNEPKRSRRRPPMTMKEAVVKVLQDTGRGMTALEILPRINELIGNKYERTSLSPQLSRLRYDGIIERNGVVWRLVEKQQDLNDMPSK